jgi:hypothetical protein
MASVFIRTPRKDGKYPVRFCFESGKVIDKVFTAEKMAEVKAKWTQDGDKVVDYNQPVPRGLYGA